MHGDNTVVIWCTFVDGIPSVNTTISPASASCFAQIRSIALSQISSVVYTATDFSGLTPQLICILLSVASSGLIPIIPVFGLNLDTTLAVAPDTVGVTIHFARRHTNEERGIKRKLSSLRSFYKYLYKNEFIQSNPASKVSTPKIHDKNIIRLDADEVANLLDEVESGENLTKKQQMFHDRTKVRDLALLTLMLGTGIRVSECVGLDLDDVDLKNNGIKIHRKGGAEVVVYFGEEVRNALCGYMEERKLITPVSGDENALFLSMQKRRIGVRAVENLVKKYAKLVTNLKNITPHKLRSTYGTSLYRETGDIYLVADVLGHKDVNTTKKHYAAIEEDRRRSAAKYVHLRED